MNKQHPPKKTALLIFFKKMESQDAADLERVSIYFLRQIKMGLNVNVYAPDFKASRATRLRTIWDEVLLYMSTATSDESAYKSYTMPFLMYSPIPKEAVDPSWPDQERLNGRIYNTLSACLAHYAMAKETPAALCALYYVLRFMLPRVTPRLHQEQCWDERLSPDIMEALFPGKRATWLSDILKYTVRHSAEMHTAFDPLKRPTAHIQIKSIFDTVSDDITSIQLSMPVLWKIDTDAATLTSFALSPYMSSPDGVEIVKQWMDEVSPGCTRDMGWTWMTRAALYNANHVVLDKNGLNWIRGAWTYSMVLQKAEFMDKVKMAFRIRSFDFTDSTSDIVIGTWIDAACFAAAINSSPFPRNNLQHWWKDVDLVGVGKSNGADSLHYGLKVLDFLGEDGLRGDDAYLNWLSSSYTMTYETYQFQYESSKMIFARHAQWIKRIVEAERRHLKEEPYRFFYVDKIVRTVVIFRDEMAYRFFLRFKSHPLNGDFLYFTQTNLTSQELLRLERIIFQNETESGPQRLDGMRPLNDVLS